MQNKYLDSNSSQLVNFPFAVTVFTMLLLGLCGMAWGMILQSVFLETAGFLLSLLGGVLCARGLCVD